MVHIMRVAIRPEYSVAIVEESSVSIKPSAIPTSSQASRNVPNVGMNASSASVTAQPQTAHLSIVSRGTRPITANEITSAAQLPANANELGMPCAEDSRPKC